MGENKTYSFGVSRGLCKKTFVNEIKKRGDTDNPGAGKYEPRKTFGKEGLHFNMRYKDRRPKLELLKSKKLPGPGSYSYREVTGKQLLLSPMKTQSQYSFGKAHDRWVAPT